MSPRRDGDARTIGLPLDTPGSPSVPSERSAYDHTVNTPKAPDRGPSTWANLYRLGTMGYELVLAIVVVGALGFGADWALGTRPWLLVCGLLAGIVVGMLRFMREASAALGSRSRGLSERSQKHER